MAMLALVYTTLPDRETAMRIARSLIERRLVACANLTEITSVYAWQGAVEEGSEIGALFKTRSDLVKQVIAALEADHPYDVPAILSWQAADSADATQAWLQNETGGT